MLMYLASNSYPEIAFEVLQCARFGHNPKQSHGKAVIRIGRYLRGAKGNGLIIKPGEELKLDCYASDPDFSGLWNSKDVDDPICVQSRNGFILTLDGAPLYWSSVM
jgi:hypothetical protein